MHGGDFTSVGSRNSLDWFEASVAETVRGQRPPSAWTRQDGREGGQCEEPDRQVVRQRLGLVLYEADPRQAQNLSDECGVEGAKPTPLTAPGARDWTATDVANHRNLAAVWAPKKAKPTSNRGRMKQILPGDLGTLSVVLCIATFDFIR